MAKTGRPSKYRADFCKAVIEHCAQGMSLASFAARVRVNRDTIHQWARDHDDFSEATGRAKAAACLFWEGIALRIADGGPGNARLAMLALRNLCSDDWAPRREAVAGSQPFEIVVAPDCCPVQ